MNDASTRRLRRIAWSRPRWFLAVKTGAAATLAWLVAQPLGDLGAHYSYYAPLGALAAMTTSVVSSARTAAQAVLAIGIGAALALLIRVSPAPGPLGLGVAITVGVLVAGWPRLGAMGSWVPFAALFVLIAGAGDPFGYTAAYAGLTALGGLVGVAVTALLPQLPLTPVDQVQHRLRAELADELDRLATSIDREIVDDEDWAALRSALARRAREAEDLIVHAREARRANWQASRWSAAADRSDDRARALQRLSGCVDEVIALISDQRTDIRRDDPDSAELRGSVAAALRAVATLIRENGEEEVSSPETIDRARDAVEGLRAQVVRTQQRSSLPHLAAAAIALDLDGAVEAWS
ncbi:aromatic acid exporter family protein [Nocardioides sambongensis]|uniref:hypothetical protein n=1 Tax=Nocardioides sambongensis TaxID=2589074 RepID=UPI00112AC06B|nr:hypothetical protein [Nocardioides sambongensis]